MSSCKKQMFNRVWNYSYGVIQALAYSGDRHSKLACSAGVFWAAKTACSCSCCCSRYLWFYDSGRLGRVEIATLREPLGWVLTRPISSSLLEFQTGAFASKNIRAPAKKTPALQSYSKLTHKLNMSLNAILVFQCRYVFHVCFCFVLFFLLLGTNSMEWVSLWNIKWLMFI